MIMAELKSKVPEAIGMEDILTSDVFGLIKYIDPGLILKDILNASVSFSGKGSFNATKIIEASYYFWPKISFTYNSRCKVREPDIAIILKGEDHTETAIIVEVKYRSGKSNIIEQQEQDDESINNPIPFISCGYIKGLTSFGTGKIFYSAGWQGGKSTTCSSSIYKTQYDDAFISEIKNYFLPLDSIKRKESIENLIVKPLLLLYQGKDNEAQSLIAGNTLTVDDIKGV